MPRGARDEAGFTLIELIIVTAILSILAAISIPKLLQSKDTSYEAGAQAYLRAIHQGEVMYETKHGQLATLDELKAGAYIRQDDLSTYAVSLTIISGGGDFTATATPTFRANELRHFFVDGSGVVRYQQGAPADVNSPPM